MRRCIRQVLVNAAIVMVSITFMLGTAEFFCRTFVDDGMHYHLEMWKYAARLKRISHDPAIGHEHVPSARAKLMGVDVQINDHGLRGPSITSPKPDDVHRIVLLGDSMVFGWGVALSDTLSERLQKNLSAEADDTYEVINAGVGNYNTTMEVAHFLSKAAMLQPDTIILAYFINDAELTPNHDAVSRIKSSSYLAVLLEGAFDTIARRFFWRKDWKDYYHDLYRKNTGGWSSATDSIRKLSEYCHEENIQLIMVNIPELRELDPYPFSKVTSLLANLAESLSLPFIDLLPAVRDINPQDLWVTVPDPHPNAHANRFLAEYLASSLRRNDGIISTPASVITPK